ncbi:peptide ABC transporter ATP-binding protein [Blautia sp. An249]|uniref:ABC transporter ATP-binding protein n=1 Tax=Blautia sp. An249 TaxID=1965603 RepID=UPI000B379D75|nr:ABC transporter ATP-binding protein [Blautia sp. An249]OUO80725.1 peptide ABC transporter ATP-binding protein [Blautia sp. An249]
MQNGRKLLEVKDLNIEFYDTTPPERVVKGVSFSMEKGEILGIVGESGSGKTQTALSILRLLKSNSGISGGQILFKDRDLGLYSEQELEQVRGGEIAMIFQEPMTSLNPVLTVGSQIEEGLSLHTKLSAEERKRRAILAMEEAGLQRAEELYQKYPHQLSGGMRQRVMIAAALVTEPDLLIADEPTTALDVTIQAQILELLKEINRKHGTGILFISHDLAVIRRLCRRVLVMNEGRVEEAGEVEMVFEHPEKEYTRKLLAAIPNRRESLRRRRHG